MLLYFVTTCMAKCSPESQLCEIIARPFKERLVCFEKRRKLFDAQARLLCTSNIGVKHIANREVFIEGNLQIFFLYVLIQS